MRQLRYTSKTAFHGYHINQRRVNAGLTEYDIGIKRSGRSAPCQRLFYDLPPI